MTTNGMVAIPYLNFDGTCAEAFRFYHRLLGGELHLMTHGDSPIADQVPDAMRDRVLHARIEAGSLVLMASDAMLGRYQAPQGTWVSLGVSSAGEGRRIFDALAEGGAVVMPLQKTFWAEVFGMCIDRFGTPWMVNGAAA